MILVIVESPSKCKKIESYLGHGYKCIASFGHIYHLNGLSSINMKTFEPKYELDVKKKIELINFGEGFHSLETFENVKFKWMSDRNEIYINEDIDYLTLDIINVVESNIFQVINDKGIVSVFNLNEGSQSIKISVKNTNKIVIESGFFIPSKTTNCTNDDRKLSCKLFDIKVTSNNKEVNIPVNLINYTNENVRKINDNGKSATEYVGDYGEMSVRIKDSNVSGKINLGL